MSRYKSGLLLVCCRREDAANRPKLEFVPKTLQDLNVEGLSDGLNGAPLPSLVHKNSGVYPRARTNPPPPTIGWNVNELDNRPPVKRKIFISIIFTLEEDLVFKWCPALAYLFFFSVCMRSYCMSISIKIGLKIIMFYNTCFCVLWLQQVLTQKHFFFTTLFFDN